MNVLVGTYENIVKYITFQNRVHNRSSAVWEIGWKIGSFSTQVSIHCSATESVGYQPHFLGIESSASSRKCGTLPIYTRTASKELLHSLLANSLIF